MKENVDAPSDWHSHLVCCWECCLPRTISEFLSENCARPKSNASSRASSLPWGHHMQCLVCAKGWTGVAFCFTWDSARPSFLSSLWDWLRACCNGIPVSPLTSPAFLMPRQALLWRTLSERLAPCKYPAQSLFLKELGLRFKRSLSLFQLSDEKQKFLMGFQDNLTYLSGYCFIFSQLNLELLEPFWAAKAFILPKLWN